MSTRSSSAPPSLWHATTEPEQEQAPVFRPAADPVEAEAEQELEPTDPSYDIVPATAPERTDAPTAAAPAATTTATMEAPTTTTAPEAAEAATQHAGGAGAVSFPCRDVRQTAVFLNQQVTPTANAKAPPLGASLCPA